MTDTITIELPRADRIDGKHVYAATNARGHWMIWMQDDRPPIEKLLRGSQEVSRDSAEEWVQWWDEHIDYWRSEAVDPAEYRQLVEAMRKAHRFIESKTSGEESTQAGMALLNALDRNRQRSLKVSGGSDTEWIIPNIAANPTNSLENLDDLLLRIEKACDGIDRDRREPDKVLCGTQAIRGEIGRYRAANPSPPEEGVRLTGEFVAKRNPDGEIEHHFISEGDADVLFAATPEAIPLAGPVEILIRPLSEGESNE